MGAMRSFALAKGKALVAGESHPPPPVLSGYHPGRASNFRVGLVEGGSAGRVEVTALEKTFNPLHLLGLTLLFTACQPLPPAEPAPATVSPDAPAFVQASCGGCHAVGRTGMSSNSNAPPFPAIVNQEGLTEETLTFWLRGAHNYPREMDFYLGEREVDALVAYMLTLRDPNYRRPPD